MNPHSYRQSQTIDSKALRHFLTRSQGYLRLAAESLHATVLDPIGFAARLGEQMSALESELKNAIEVES